MSKLEQDYKERGLLEELKALRSEYGSTEKTKYRRLNILKHLEDYLGELRKEYPHVGIVGVGECFSDLKLNDEGGKSFFTYLRVFIKYDILDPEVKMLSLTTTSEFKMAFAADVFEDLDEQVEFKVVEEEDSAEKA